MSAPNALIASAQRVKLGRPKRGAGAWSTKSWQEEARGYFDIGEVKFSTGFVANGISRLVLRVEEQKADGSWEVTSDADALKALKALESDESGHARMLRALATNLFTVGEAFIIGREPAPTVQQPSVGPQPTTDAEPLDAQGDLRWSVRSIFELKVKSAGYELSDGTEKIMLTDQNAVVIRIWQEDPFMHNEADSSLKGVLAPCEQLLRSERHIRAVSTSRSASGKLVLLPSELQLPTVVGPDGNELDGAATVLKQFTDALVAAVQDEGSASAVAPIVLMGPGEAIAKAQVIDLALSVDPELAKQDNALMRFVQGIDLPPEVVQGKSSLSLLGMAFQISEDVWTAHLAPRADLIVNGLTLGYLRAVLPEAKADRFRIWYDNSNFVVRPNKGDDADKGLEKGTISEASWRETKGFTEDDAPTPEERLQRLGINRGTLTPELTEVLLRLLDAALPKPEPAATVPITASAKPTTAERLLNLDRSARDKLTGLCEAALERALDRAGSRVFSQIRNGEKATLAKTVPLSQVIVVTGFTADASLLDGGFPGLQDSFYRLSRSTRRDALRILGISETEMRQARSERSFAEGWGVLETKLRDLAFARLTEPDFTGLDALGERPDSTVAPGIIRAALAAAGGALQDGGRPDGDATLLTDDTPAGGIALGVDVLADAGEDLGASISGWTWVYGDAPRTRSFEPHLALDGVHFDSWDDEVLANNEGWPPNSRFVPGDHGGCSCDWLPDLDIPEKE